MLMADVGGGKNENGRVASPESILVHFRVCGDTSKGDQSGLPPGWGGRGLILWPGLPLACSSSNVGSDIPDLS